MNKQAPPSQNTHLLTGNGGPSSELNQQHLVGEAPPPAYTPSPYSGLPTFRPSPVQEPFHPPTVSEAKANARARFFKAVLMAFFIWLAIGAIFGGGVEDMREDEGRHRSRPYPPPRITHYEAAVQPAATASVQDLMK